MEYCVVVGRKHHLKSLINKPVSTGSTDPAGGTTLLTFANISINSINTVGPLLLIVITPFPNLFDIVVVRLRYRRGFRVEILTALVVNVRKGIFLNVPIHTFQSKGSFTIVNIFLFVQRVLILRPPSPSPN